MSKTKLFLILILLSNTFELLSQAPFITTWKTDNPGTSCNSCVTISTHYDMIYDFEVDWDNDGVYDQSGITETVTHDFGEPGTYTIAVRGVFPTIAFVGVTVSNDGQKLIQINQWGDIQWKSMSGSFHGCKNLLGGSIDSPDLSEVESLTGMFSGAENFNQDICDWDVSNVKQMGYMFKDAYKFNQDISCWDVSNVINMEHMFEGAESFNQNIVEWDVSNVKNMRNMFQNAFNFNQDIGNWDVSNLVEMRYMFLFAKSFNQDIGNWDVSNAIEMNHMFAEAENFNQDIGNWDVSNVNDMFGMFNGASNFNQDISSWDVSNVIYMSSMFWYADSFDQDIGDWQFNPEASLNTMLNNSGMSCENYSKSLIGWAQNPETPDSLSLDAGGVFYDNVAIPSRDILINKGWSFDGDIEGECLVSADETKLNANLVYPNPATNILNVDASTYSEYTIYDSFGNKIKTGILLEGKLNIQSLVNGIYTLRVFDKTSNGMISKFIKL